MAIHEYSLSALKDAAPGCEATIRLAFQFGIDLSVRRKDRDNRSFYACLAHDIPDSVKFQPCPPEREFADY
ncbi:MAG: hypothetical protein APF80_07775 [Alphaproteobacteria bacterium BRH_c36]|nr:MAG: hypothetical protein APF80_07775 [Alphaproteobacteria bacterium BRH_c36]